jgi:hypothetical protein
VGVVGVVALLSTATSTTTSGTSAISGNSQSAENQFQLTAGVQQVLIEFFEAPPRPLLVFGLPAEYGCFSKVMRKALYPPQDTVYIRVHLLLLLLLY